MPISSGIFCRPRGVQQRGYLIGDSSSAPNGAPPAQKRAEDQGLGRSRAALSTKIHMAVRGLGCPLRFKPTEGQRAMCHKPMH
jgi:hypothetical protein